MTILLMASVLATLAASFVLHQHGYANTVKSIAVALLEHAERKERRVERRRAEVNQQLVRHLEVMG